MANPVINNVYLTPGSGWNLLASGGAATQLRVSYFPHHIPVFFYVGASAPSLKPTTATGTVTFATGVPTANQTVLVGSETYTFVALRSAAFQVTIGASNTATAANFVTAVNTDSALVRASAAAGVVTLTAVLTGPSGNYTLSTAATNVSVVTMSGGALAQTGFRLDSGHAFFDGAYTGNLYARTQNNNGDVVAVSIWQN